MWGAPLSAEFWPPRYDRTMETESKSHRDMEPESQRVQEFKNQRSREPEGQRVKESESQRVGESESQRDTTIFPDLFRIPHPRVRGAVKQFCINTMKLTTLYNARTMRTPRSDAI